ncbi:SUMF1/EgtB/PvdO family nonheme iron enzyme [Nocardiopsis sp. Huas11]|uniref:formylglycine-generating enzyme family protein n=1 Tax=Nocardiopsis sp. Huas11 TaxID=2183912 RepID=UPI000EB25AE8|nr:SUMF1/EgtB/PvdO family nonheme iron enzyme [Nocardiopsis sp. Huas11]
MANLWWAATPLLHPLWNARAGLPITGICQGEAERLAREVGGRLPTSTEWGWMAGAGQRLYPWGQEEPTSAHANLRGLGPGRPTPPWSRAAGATPDGVLDVAGNVWEWTRTSVPGDGAVIRGGSYNSLTLYAQATYETEAPVHLRSAGIGVRPVKEETTCW